MADLARMVQESSMVYQSPGLNRGLGLGPAYELKFHLTEDEARRIEEWARMNLKADPHGENGSYQITSLYCDTPSLDVYFRSKGYRRSKFRIRRYGNSPHVFLERKSKRKDQVRKKRVAILDEQLNMLDGAAPDPEWVGAWFRKRLQKKQLLPACAVSYRRTAFFASTSDGPIRLTLDRELVGAKMATWVVPHIESGVPLFSTGALLELKFHGLMPALFRDVLPSTPARASKYRLGVDLCGVSPIDNNGYRWNLADAAQERNGDADRDA